MPVLFKQGDAVTIRHTTLTGVVQEPQFIDGDIQYLTNYNDNDGNPQSRCFPETGLIAVPVVEFGTGA